MTQNNISSTFAILDVKDGREALAEHFFEKAPPIPVTITGYIVGTWGDDDGISQEFEVVVESVTTGSQEEKPEIEVLTKIHWHEHNPWKDKVVYVPLEELVAAISPDSVNRIIGNWVSVYGFKLDAYLLPSDSGWISGGVRFGPDGSDYIAPLFDQEKLKELLDKHKPT